ncbi:hypothetical protein PCANB_001324 [Pneumocystis canis]|nr:hypothetical protein PCANB_001324 [Pneumocystis canis]
MKNIIPFVFAGIIFFLKFTYAFNDALNSNPTDYVSNNDDDGRSLERSQFSPRKSNKCTSIFFGAPPSNGTKKCILSNLLNSTRCGSDGDLDCVCDSRRMHKIVANCSDPFADLLFDGFYNKYCNGPRSPPPPECRVPNPSFPTVICKDPFKNGSFDSGLHKCLEDAASNSLCRGKHDASCLCDSRSFSSGAHDCATKYPKNQKKVEEYLKRFCQSPISFPGCRPGLHEDIPIKESGEGILRINLKTMLLIIGIIIPIAFGL